MRLKLFAPVLLLAGCMGAPAPQTPTATADKIETGDVYVAMPFEPSPEPPPKLGTVRLIDMEQTQVFTTYDFSVGAFDASAWFDSDMDGRGRFTLTGYPDENPRAKGGLLRVQALLPEGRIKGSEGADVSVEIWLDGKINGAKLTSAGHPASFTLDSFAQEGEGTSGYGTASGHFSAVLCPGSGDPAKVELGTGCKEVEGRFDTRVQYSP